MTNSAMPSEIGRLEHDGHAGKRIATHAAGRARRLSRGRTGGRRQRRVSAHLREKRALAEDGDEEHRGAEEQDAGNSHLIDDAVGDERPDERARGAAGGDEAEQALGLFAPEQLEQETPEHRDQEEIDDTDADVENASDDHVLRIGAKHEAGGGERNRHGAVDGGHQRRATHSRDQESVNGNDCDGEHGGPDPGVAGDGLAEDRAHGFTNRAHRKIAAHDAEHQHECGENRALLAGLDANEACEEIVELLNHALRFRGGFLVSAPILGISRVTGRVNSPGRSSSPAD